MTGRPLALLGLCIAINAGAAESPAPESPRDLFLGEAFFYAHQGEHFDAIARLDTELQQFRRVDEPDRDPLHFHLKHAEFSVGDFELSYRMHQRAGRAIRAVLEGDVSPVIRNEAAYRLARLYYEKSEPEQALAVIGRINGRLPDRLHDDERLLRAQIDIANGRFGEAVALLEPLTSVSGVEGFAGYNLGVALLRQGNTRDGYAALARAGQIEAEDEAARAIRDKANLTLGFRLLKAEKPEEARQYLDRVRLTGPFSDNALLGSGWADVTQGRHDRALVPWSLLIQRNATGKAVQEALLGVPFAYAKLDKHGRAALLYGSALESFGQEIERLKASVESIRAGRFLAALVREELKQDSNWVVRLRELPETPETYYLTELMAANDFQSALQNYRDLDALRLRLLRWEGSVEAFAELIALRRRYYEPLLPDIDRRFRALDSQMRLRLEQRQSLDDRLQRLLVAPRPELLATADERLLREQIAALEARHAGDDTPAGQEARRRIARLKGVIHWDIHSNYDQRLTDAYVHLHALDADVARLREIHAGYVRTRQAATQSYQGYDAQIGQARERLGEAKTRVAALMARQGQMLEQMAVSELELRRGRLEEYQVQARFAMAESYDRAIKAQQQAGGRAK
ncbi:MAG: hypothetical protein K0S46_1225 [Moraxellaceae bacterium]|jgi:hypothetical protein|nr:hypothetical protein [Moraxellaceae bacterium]